MAKTQLLEASTTKVPTNPTHLTLTTNHHGISQRPPFAPVSQRSKTSRVHPVTFIPLDEPESFEAKAHTHTFTPPPPFHLLGPAALPSVRVITEPKSKAHVSIYPAISVLKPNHNFEAGQRESPHPLHDAVHLPLLSLLMRGQ